MLAPSAIHHPLLRGVQPQVLREEITIAGEGSPAGLEASQVRRPQVQHLRAVRSGYRDLLPALLPPLVLQTSHRNPLNNRPMPNLRVNIKALPLLVFIMPREVYQDRVRLNEDLPAVGTILQGVYGVA